ncbi:hypothetical protein M3Y97_00282800 [Aphelenchoides bicaudatus]|nr:hypothetical protein M3Y97_00282800 [Aphelenchoides bicaudatus]
MEVQKLAIFAGEFENTINSTVRQTNNGRFLWGCRKNRKVEDLVTAIDTVYQVEREFKLNLFDLEFLLNYVPFNEHFGCVIGCESKRGLCISIVQIHKNKVDPIGIGYNLNELASICHLPVVQKIDSNLLAIQIMQIDVLTGQNMLPRLFILQIPFERTGNIRLKHSIQLLYENETTKLLLHKEDKLYYFPVKKQFDKLVQIDLKTGDSYLKQLDSFPLLLDAVNSRDIRVTCEQDKFCILAFPQLAIFDLNSWKWSKIKLIEHPHMKQPSLLFVNSHGNLVTYFHKENSKQRLQIYIWQLQQPESLRTLCTITCKKSGLLKKLQNRSSLFEEDSLNQKDTSNHVKQFRTFS